MFFFWDGMKHDIHTFVAECDACQCNKGETFKAPGTLQSLPIPPSIRWDIYVDFIVGLPESGNKQSSWWWLTIFQNMLISVLFHILSPHPHWLKFSWIISSNFMACLILLFMIEIPLSLAIFGKNFSGYMAPNCISALPIIHRLMEKLKLSTSVWKHI
jgi:hypothetical protein